MHTIKNIEGIFDALSIDIVANEGKGIFYAKNKLGMTDRNTIEDKEQFKPIEVIVKYSDDINPL
jgi:hypothetical protein